MSLISNKQAIVGVALIAAIGVIGGALWLGGGTGLTVAAYDGKALYQENCAGCHGAKLKGQPNWRSTNADGKLPAPPHDASGHTWHHRDDLLFRITKFGTAQIIGGDYKSDMAGFKDVLGDAQIVAVLDYIKSTWPERIRKRQARMSKSKP